MKIKSWIVLLFCSWITAGCAAETVLDVQLLGLPPDAIRLDVTAALDDQAPLEGQQSLTPALERMRLRLAGAPTGNLTLHVRAIGRDNCAVAAGDGVLRISGARSEPVSLQLLPRPGCRIDVEFIGSPKGVVQAATSAIRCSTNCQLSVRRDESVSLLFVPEPGYVLGGWFAPATQPACSGRGLCSLRAEDGVIRVQVAALHEASCSPSSWCVEEDAPPLTSAYYGLWGESRESLWAVGDAGAMLHSDGFAWRTVGRVTSRNLRAIWGSGPADIWAVGESGTMLHYDGAAWTAQPPVTASWLLSIWGTAADNIWAVGEAGRALHWDGTRWHPADLGTTKTLRSIWGSGANAVWVVGDAGTIRAFDGTAWSTVISNTSVALHSVAGVAGPGVWVVGDFGTAMYIPGLGMQPIPIATGLSASLRTVFWPSSDGSSSACPGSGGCAAWAAGVGGMMVPLVPTVSRTAPLPSSFDPAGIINSIFGTSASHLWAIGQGATLIRYRP